MLNVESKQYLTASATSFAFNFGTLDPVRAHVHVAAATAPPRVKLKVEAVVARRAAMAVEVA